MFHVWRRRVRRGRLLRQSSLQEAYKTNFHGGAMKNPDGSQKKIRALSIFDAQFLTTLSYMTIALNCAPPSFAGTAS
jgi:hypothetical protein